MSTAAKKRRRSPSAKSRKKLHTETNETTTTSAPDKTPELDADYAKFAEEMRGIGVTLTDPTEIGDKAEVSDKTETTTPARPANPWAGTLKKLSSQWGTSVHDQMHTAPTDAKAYHGVWGTKNLTKVREWVRLACDSIYADDNYVVASKPGKDGGRNYLVDMDGETVGYISGSKVEPGTKPEAKHLAVYVNRKGYPVTAFPCTPEVFQRDEEG
jgi:hypothetical protein